jgi:hypothetical protein
MIRALAHQNERLRLRIAALEARLGAGPAYDVEASHQPYEGEELPPADGG